MTRVDCHGGLHQRRDGQWPTKLPIAHHANAAAVLWQLKLVVCTSRLSLCAHSDASDAAAVMGSIILWESELNCGKVLCSSHAAHSWRTLS